MESITIKCPITVKSKVTEDLKKRIISDLTENLNKVNMELQQLEQQAQQVMAEQGQNDPQQLAAIRHHFEGEAQKRFEFKQQVEGKMKETESLELGAEIAQGTLEQIVTLKVGDDLHAYLNAEILLEDGVIRAFRM